MDRFVALQTFRIVEISEEFGCFDSPPNPTTLTRVGWGVAVRPPPPPLNLPSAGLEEDKSAANLRSDVEETNL